MEVSMGIHRILLTIDPMFDERMGIRPSMLELLSIIPIEPSSTHHPFFHDSWSSIVSRKLQNKNLKNFRKSGSFLDLNL